MKKEGILYAEKRVFNFSARSFNITCAGFMKKPAKQMLNYENSG